MVTVVPAKAASRWEASGLRCGFGMLKSTVRFLAELESGF
jgi:hypothetical protein